MRMLPTSCWALLIALAMVGPAQSRPGLMLRWEREDRLVGALLSRLSSSPSIGRVYLIAYDGGKVVHPTRIQGLTSASFSVGGANFDEILRRVQSAGRPWASGGDLLDISLCRAKWPQLSEINRNLAACGANSPGGLLDGRQTGVRLKGAMRAYLSTEQPQVRQLLDALVGEWSAWDRAPNALLLAIRQSATELLGYSATAREHCILATGLDPLDCTTPDEMALWCTWREQQMTQLVGDLVLRYRVRHPATPLIAMGTGDLPIRSTEARCASADNWLLWLEQGLAQEALLDTVWEPKRTGRIWGTLRQLSLANLQRSGKTFLGTPEAPLSKLHPLIGYTHDEGDPTLEEQYATLKAEGAPMDSVAFCPNSLEELDRILALLKAEGKGAK